MKRISLGSGDGMTSPYLPETRREAPASSSHSRPRPLESSLSSFNNSQTDLSSSKRVPRAAPADSRSSTSKRNATLPTDDASRSANQVVAKQLCQFRWHMVPLEHRVACASATSAVQMLMCHEGSGTSIQGNHAASQTRLRNSISVSEHEQGNALRTGRSSGYGAQGRSVTSSIAGRSEELLSYGDLKRRERINKAAAEALHLAFDSTYAAATNAALSSGKLPKVLQRVHQIPNEDVAAVISTYKEMAAENVSQSSSRKRWLGIASRQA